jgi:hypothetical protein
VLREHIEEWSRADRVRWSSFFWYVGSALFVIAGCTRQSPPATILTTEDVSQTTGLSIPMQVRNTHFASTTAMTLSIWGGFTCDSKTLDEFLASNRDFIKKSSNEELVPLKRLEWWDTDGIAVANQYSFKRTRTISGEPWTCSGDIWIGRNPADPPSENRVLILYVEEP